MRKTIIGIKLTHDAGASVISGDGNLIAAIEAEKSSNRPRHDTFSGIDEAIEALSGVTPVSGDETIVIDGWKSGVLRKHNMMQVAPYHEFDPIDHPVFNSHPHVHGHVAGGYMMSPFAQEGQGAFVLCWDGGCGAMLYRVDDGDIKFIKRLFPFYGMIYSIMCYYAGPYAEPNFKPDFTQDQFGRYDWPGKVMSWLKTGVSDPADVSQFISRASALFEGQPMGVNQNGHLEHKMVHIALEIAEGDGERMLSLVHDSIGQMLVDGLKSAVGSDDNLVFVGGSALNIKWNSLIRRNVTPNLFIPPCPNDSGSAIGVAAVEYMKRGGKAINWSVYAGQEIKPLQGPAHSPWERIGGYSADRIAQLMVDGYVVIHLCGRAEIGPRALGNRSMFALPNLEMKKALNDLKRREAWRPVAPICLADRANEFFGNESEDPYMLFDHQCKKACAEVAAGIVHTDGTARLQTITRDQNPNVYGIIEALVELGQPPIICNTSANHNGSGFFDSVESAMAWAEEFGHVHPHIVIADGLSLWRFHQESDELV